MLSAIPHEPLVVWTLRSFLAALFLTAALSKLTAIDEFHGVVRNFRLLPDGLARPVAMVLPVVEMAIAAGLLIGPLARPAALAAAALLARLGEDEFWKLAAAMNEAAPLDLRVNTLKLKREEAQAQLAAGEGAAMAEGSGLGAGPQAAARRRRQDDAARRRTCEAIQFHRAQAGADAEMGCRRGAAADGCGTDHLFRRRSADELRIAQPPQPAQIRSVERR